MEIVENGLFPIVRDIVNYNTTLKLRFSAGILWYIPMITFIVIEGPIDIVVARRLWTALSDSGDCEGERTIEQREEERVKTVREEFSGDLW